MAPEQEAGQPVDIRADLYALGATLFKLLTGVLPVSPTDRTKRKSLAALRPDCPSELVQIIERLLAYSPDSRLQKPSEVVEALQPFAVNADLKALGLRFDRDRDTVRVLAEPTIKVTAHKQSRGSIIPGLATLLFCMLMLAGVVWSLQASSNSVVATTPSKPNWISVHLTEQLKIVTTTFLNEVSQTVVNGTPGLQIKSGGLVTVKVGQTQATPISYRARLQLFDSGTCGIFFGTDRKRDKDATYNSFHTIDIHASGKGAERKTNLEWAIYSMPQKGLSVIRRTVKRWEIELDPSRTFQELLVEVNANTVTIYLNNKEIETNYSIDSYLASLPQQYPGNQNRTGDFGLFVDRGEAVFSKFEYHLGTLPSE
jgi:hypothetical protein